MQKKKETLPRNSTLLLFLFALAVLNITLDFQLTEYALDNGFYETNKFTLATNPAFHGGVLLFIVVSLVICAVSVSKYRNGVLWFLGVFNVVWLVNNAYSLWLLI